MAEIPFNVDANFNYNSLIKALMYPLSTANRTALSLGSTNKGLLVWDTDLLKLMAWNGTAWQDAVPYPSGGLTLKGGIAASATAPASPANGDFYVFTSAGTTGVSWVPQADVAIGDAVFWDNAGSVWRYLEKNDAAATTTVAGLIKLADQTITDAGSATDAAVTPSSLAGYTPPASLTKRLTRRVPTVISSLVGGTPSTVTHNLLLNNKEDVQVQCWQGAVRIYLAITAVDTNSIQVASNQTLSNVTVICEG